MTQETKKNLLLSVALVAFMVAMRLLTHFTTHAWNVAPVAAGALLAGAVMPRKWAVGVPLVGMLLADSIIGFYHLQVMFTVYACFAASGLLGSWLKDMKPTKILGASLASSTLFFLVTNFAVWATADWYEKSWRGLALCYTLAIPFFRNTMLGDLMFTGVLFGVWALVRQGVVCLKNIFNTGSVQSS